MTLRLILGDQLSETISSLRDVDKLNDNILICEVKSEATYVNTTRKKLHFYSLLCDIFQNFLKV